MDTHETPPPGRRLCFLGTSGSGKSYVAIEAARRLGLRYISNDALIWGAGWQPTPRADRPALFDAATRDDDDRGWTFDGNVTGKDPEDRIVLDRCDTLVWLDLPRRQVWTQVLRRTLRRVVTREALWHGNVETWRMALGRDSIVLWSLRTFARVAARSARCLRIPATAIASASASPRVARCERGSPPSATLRTSERSA